jgi:hypothetical protein
MCPPDGGINDVKIERLLSPFTSLDQLESLVEQCCYRDMVTLLTEVAAKFNAADCRIIVVGYYPILSDDSNPLALPRLLTALGHDFSKERALRAQGFPLSDPVELSLLFWTCSDTALKHAVTDVNAGAGTNCISFVSPGFGPKNSVFASEPWLWELGFDLMP